MKALDPDGHAWRVHRQWAPRLEGRGLRARFRRMGQRRKGGDSWAEVIDLPADLPDSLTFILVIGAALAAVALFVLIGLPLLLVVLDVVVVIALIVAGVVARVVFRRPWTVVARADDGRESADRAVGWSASRRLKEDLTARITGGLIPPRTGSSC